MSGPGHGAGIGLERQALDALRRMRGRLEELESARSEPIAVVGLGCRVPGAAGPEAFWDLLCRGGDAVRSVPRERWDVTKLGQDVPSYAGLLDDVERFDADFFGIPGREARLLDPQQRMFLEVTWEALEHAGIPPRTLRGSRTGVFTGATMSDYLRLLMDRLSSEELDAYLVSGNALNAIPGRVSFTLGLQGPSLAIDTACSSSLVAVDRACRSLRDGECRLAIAGGVNAVLVPETLLSLARWGMLAPDGRCKTFDASANGFVRAEGCGVLLLKRQSHALADGDRILALIRGSAVNQDGPSGGFTVPNGLAQAGVIRDALQAANVNPRDVGYVEAHGTGTALGDPIEMEALSTVYGAGRERERALVVGAVKSNLGHLESASGVAGVIKTILVLQHRQIPPNIHFSRPTPNIPWQSIAVRVPTTLEVWEPSEGPRLAGVSSFGFSGTNAHLILQEAPAEAPVDPPVVPPPFLLTLSARSASSLDTLARRFAEVLEQPEAPDPATLCHAAAAGRSHHALRLAALGADSAELAQRLRASADGGDVAGVLRGRSGRRPTVAFLFTGQGAQYPGMGRALAQANPVFGAAMERCAALIDPLLGRSLLDLVCGREATSETLARTGYAQPALFALGWALTEMWRSYDVTPSLVMGHSVGEFTAACAAGVLSLEDAARLVVVRGRLMQSLPEGGAMAAVFAPEPVVRVCLAGAAGVVVISGVNAPDEVVVSGERDALRSLCGRLAVDGIRAEPLTVSHAFHSPLMQPMISDFSAAARSVARAPRRLRIVSSVTGELAEDAWGGPDYWVRQILAPVRFGDAMRSVIAAGADVVVEIGPHPVLTALGRRSMPDSDVCWLPSLRRERDDQATVMASLAELYVRGATDDWSGETGARHRSRVEMPVYPFQRTRHWVDERAPEMHGGPVPAASWCHPLLGGRVALAVPEVVYQVEGGHAAHRSVRDHRIGGHIVWPAAATVEMALAAARECFGAGPLEVADLQLLAPVLLPDEGTVPLQTVITASGADDRRVVFHVAEDPEGHRWSAFAEAHIRRPQAESADPDPGMAGARERCTQPVAPARLHDALGRLGLEFGPAFRSLDTISIGAGEALGLVRLPEAVAAAEQGCLLHPALLDGCMQLAFVAAGGVTGGELPRLVPAGLSRLRWYAPATGAVWGSARVLEGDAARALKADVTLWSEGGALIAAVEGLRFSRGSGTLAPGSEALATDRYECVWRPLTAEAAPAGPQRILVLTDDAQLAEDLSSAADSTGDRVMLEQARDRSSSTLSELLKIAAERLGGPLSHAVLIFDEVGPTDRLKDALHLAQACAAGSSSTPPRLWFVTRGAQAVRTGENVSPAAATIWGFARVLRAEHPELACTAVDVDAGADALRLLETLRRTERAESQVAVRDGTHFAARLVRSEDPSDVRLVVEQPGQLESVRQARFTPGDPGPGQVRIDVRAAGLNFRDVLCALGLYPGAVEALGGECAGVVAAVGPGVTTLAEGDEVLAFAPGAMATSVVVPADFVVRRPPSLGVEAAAAIPVAYLTASFGLERLAGLRAGERVLIHAATGGVGLAAVRIAQLLGAEVFATAGSEPKRRLLRDLGVRHVFDSRSVAFRDEILACTNGAGVHVVLNSLVGAALDASLAVVMNGGAFLEMGKRDLRSADAVRRAHPGVRYLPYDVGEEVMRDPRLGAELLAICVERIQRGDFPPLPVTVGSLAAPLETLRTMAQARHVGKLVLRQDITGHRAPAAMRSDATYLVTGGLGALGLAVARGLVRRGARHIVLVGRRPPTADATRALDALAAEGATIRTACADVADRPALEALFADLYTSMPPVRGVVHAAGVLDDGVLAQQDWSRFEQVLRPKLLGAGHLDELTRAMSLDFFVLFSSAAGWLGAAGQANYAAANASLDGLAIARRAAGRPGLSIAWGRWAEAGMAASVRRSEEWDSTGLGAIPVDAGVETMFDLTRRGATQVAVVPVEWTRYLGKVFGDSPPRFFAEVLGHAVAPAAVRAPLVATLRNTPRGQRRAALERHLEGIVRRVVGVPAAQSIASDLPLRELGLDSLMTVELRNAIAQAIDHPLPATLLFDHPSLRELTAHLHSSVLAFDDAEPVRTTADAAVVRALSEEDAEALLLRELDGGAGV